MMSKRWSLIALKIALSVFAVFHVFSVILAPNGQTYLGLKTVKFVEPYVDLFELTNAWSFFAPEPGPPVFVEWELMGKNGESLGKDRWPQTPSPFFLRERQTRRLSSSQFMVGSDTLAEKMMTPYLCSHNPHAASVKIWRVIQGAPTMLEVAEGKRTVGDEKELKRMFVAHNFCEGRT
jgi:hypothetical protein